MTQNTYHVLRVQFDSTINSKRADLRPTAKERNGEIENKSKTIIYEKSTLVFELKNLTQDSKESILLFLLKHHLLLIHQFICSIDELIQSMLQRVTATQSLDLLPRSVVPIIRLLNTKFFSEPFHIFF